MKSELTGKDGGPIETTNSKSWQTARELTEWRADDKAVEWAKCVADPAYACHALRSDRRRAGAW